MRIAATTQSRAIPTNRPLRKAGGGHIKAAPTFTHAMGAVSFIYLSILGFVVIPYMFVYMRLLKDGEGGTPALMERLYEKFSYADNPWVYRGITAVGALSIALMVLNGALTTGITQFGGYDGVVELPQNTRFLWMMLPGAALIGVYCYVSTETRKKKGMVIAAAIVAGVTAFLFTWSESTGLVVFNVVLFFCLQRFRLDTICRALGPITLAFITMITLLSIPAIMAFPVALSFLNPLTAASYAADFIKVEWANGGIGRILQILTALFLATTGGEAPFADAAPIGKRAIRVGALIVTIPVLLCYAAQAAAINQDPTAAGRSYYALVPNGYQGIVFFVTNLMANAACQALTTALFVMVSALVKAKFLPNMYIIHRGHHDDFIPKVNWTVMVLVIAMAVIFKSAEAFAGVYGLTVSAVMLISCLLVTAIRRMVWKKSKLMSFGFMLPIISGNLVFVLANAIALDGAWIAAVAGGCMAAYMYVHHMGYRKHHPMEFISLQ